MAGAVTVRKDVLRGQAVVQCDAFGEVFSPSLDAFNRLRVSAPSTLFEGVQTYDARPSLFTTLTTGAGTVVYTNARASSRLAVAGNGDRTLRQTRRYFAYQPGKSFLALLSFRFEVGGARGVKKRVGYFDDNNGLFLEASDSNQMSVVVRSNVSGQVVDTPVAREDWDDPLNGKGRSGLTLDAEKVQILAIDFEWLGVGSVRFGLVIDGQIVPICRIGHANRLTSVYMQTANLPLRWECVSTGGAGAIESICCTVSSEGGQEIAGVTRCATSNSSGVSIAAAANQNLVTIRNKSGAYLHAPVFPKAISTMCSSAGQGHWQLILNPTQNGVASWVDVANSCVQYDITRTGVTGGTVIGCGYFSGDTSQNIESNLELVTLGTDALGVQDELCLAMRNNSAAPETYYGSISWREPS